MHNAHDDSKKNVLPETDRQRNARIKLEIAQIDAQIADLHAQKAEKRAELAK